MVTYCVFALVEIVKNLGSFAADQASTIEVAVVVKGIKGEVGLRLYGVKGVE